MKTSSSLNQPEKKELWRRKLQGRRLQQDCQFFKPKSSFFKSHGFRKSVLLWISWRERIKKASKLKWLRQRSLYFWDNGPVHLSAKLPKRTPLSLTGSSTNASSSSLMHSSQSPWCHRLLVNSTSSSSIRQPSRPPPCLPSWCTQCSEEGLKNSDDTSTADILNVQWKHWSAKRSAPNLLPSISNYS